MAKLTDLNLGGSMPIGNDGLLRFIDDINGIRARSHQRRRFKPHQQSNGVLGMIEWDAVPRPNRPDTPSPRFSDGPRLVAPVK
jgi:hypothetical protein